MNLGHKEHITAGEFRVQDYLHPTWHWKTWITDVEFNPAALKSTEKTSKVFLYFMPQQDRESSRFLPFKQFESYITNMLQSMLYVLSKACTKSF